MNQWEAIVAVVQSFNEHGAYGFALAALIALSIPTLGIVAALASLLRKR